ncbi:porin family protein [Carboxylicivirga sp. N1Y90]|uniref:porin family protein n=1 Tax=Carboxylicivirga fragile TaxID=3417571 RepID=UPI003D34F964|nr:PorT family protein [Marinilabiliaceae bacterium N1Y90]
MKRILFVCILGLVSFMTISSQTIKPRFGFGLSTFATSGGSIDTDVSSRFKIHLGATYEHEMNESLMFQTGLLFEGKGAREYGAVGSFSQEVIYNPVYMIIPVAAKYYFSANSDLQFFGNGGFYAGIGLGGKAKLTENDAGNIEKESAKVFSTDALKRMDFGVEFGGGVIVPFSGMDVEFGMLLSFGLTNIGRSSNLNVNTLKNQAYKLYVAVPFSL